MFDLTPKGSKDISDFMTTVFQYLAKVRSLQKADVSEIYETMQKMSAVTFDYQEAPDSVMDLVTSLAGNMMSYAPADVLAGDTVIDEVDTKMVMQFFQQLSPDNCNLALATKDFDEKTANKNNQYYNVHYAEKPIPEAWRKAWKQQSSDEDTHAPPALKYVPESLA